MNYQLMINRLSVNNQLGINGWSMDRSTNDQSMGGQYIINELLMSDQLLVNG